MNVIVLLGAVYCVGIVVSRYWMLAIFQRKWPLTTGRQDRLASWVFALVWPIIGIPIWFLGKEKQ